MRYKKYDPEKLRKTDVHKCKTCPHFTKECVRINKERKSTHMEQHPVCWCCKHMTDGTCSFATDGIEIPGSVVKKRVSKKTNGQTIEYFNVRECPMFERG